MKIKYKWVYSNNVGTASENEISQDFLSAAGSSVVAQLLLNRGIDTPNKVDSFLNLDDAKQSSPYLFKDIDKAVDLINNTIEKQEHIVVFGDFDADGVTSTSLMYKTLKHLGANVSYYIPDRSDEGHGLNSASICKLISSRKTKLIITVDCGISNHSEIGLAKNLGTNVIITDHHEPQEILPQAYAIINPKTIEEDSDLKNLAGVGVAYKLACALLNSNNKQDYIDEIFHLVTIGTIADVVPLIGENRILVNQGLKLMAKKRPPAIVKLLESSGYKTDQDISTEMIAFGIAPRINAIGRLESANTAVDLLVSEDPEEMDTISKKLNYNNRIRQQMCGNTFIEANQRVNKEILQDEDKAIILADPNWHPGIIGIVASKLVEKYYKPVFLISIDEENNEARCSARSIDGLNLHEVLTCHADLFKQFGGHALAAGFSLDLNKTNFEKLRNLLNLTVNESIDPDSTEPKLMIDMEISPADLSGEFVKEINRLAPFGDSNPYPVFSLSNLTLKQYKTMGSGNNHLKIFLSDSNDNIIEAVWWNKSSLDVSVLDNVKIAFTPEINTFGGKTRIQLVIKDIRLSNEADEDDPADNEIFSPEKFSQSSATITKWVDHRKKTETEKLFSNYLKINDENAIIFAENQNTLELLEKDPVLKSRITNRLNVEKKAEQLLLFDLPPDWKVLTNLLEISNIKIVHLIGKTYNGITPEQIIKTLSGMLKFAHSNMNGEVNINNIASRLSTSNRVILSCVNLLNKAKVINMQTPAKEQDDMIKYEFVGSADLMSIKNLNEYDSFVETLKLTEEFRYQLATMEIEDIQKLVNKFSAELVKI